MEPRSSLPCSQEPSTGPYPGPDQYPNTVSPRPILILSSHLCLGLPSGIVPSGFPTKILYAFLFTLIHGTFPAFLERYHKDGAETWVSFVNVETKEQSKQWMHTHSPSKSLNKLCLPARKLMETVFWHRRGVLNVEFMQQGTTVTWEIDCETIENSVGLAIQNRRPGMLTYGEVLTMTIHIRIQLLALKHCWSI
jgi:hypothetical protein